MTAPIDRAPLPSVAASRERIDAAIARLADPRHRRMLEIYRAHWWGEVVNNVDAIMKTLPTDGVDYLFDGVPIFFSERYAFRTSEEARALYAGAAGSGLPMAGPFDEECFAFGDWGMSFEGVLHSVVRGAMLRNMPDPPEPDALFLTSWRTAAAHPMDLERGLMLGERVYSGSLTRFEAVDEAMVRQIYGEDVLAEAAAVAAATPPA